LAEEAEYQIASSYWRLGRYADAEKAYTGLLRVMATGLMRVQLGTLSMSIVCPANRQRLSL
jgi:hypothetical protein